MRVLGFIFFVCFIAPVASADDVVIKGKATQNLDGLSLIERIDIDLKSFEYTFHRDDPVVIILKNQLVRMAQKDSLLRKYQNEAFKTRAEAPQVLRDVWKKTRDSDVSNAIQLHAMIDRYGWIDSNRFGVEAERAAWLIAQHMVHDQGKFQRYVLQKMSENPHYNGANYAILSDRVSAIFDKEPQKFGSQGKCQKSGKWESSPIENKEFLDERRLKIGLDKFSEYSLRMDIKCSVLTNNE